MELKLKHTLLQEHWKLRIVGNGEDTGGLIAQAKSLD